MTFIGQKTGSKIIGSILKCIPVGRRKSLTAGRGWHFFTGVFINDSASSPDISIEFL
ncbi:MAG: hypothetical protein UU83_C0013G0002 [Candidatus Jorgensenbacteria bacterium GW2011_GWF2_41_8]|uniref:Uncharacterized protein n=1 Tax=Candidatus Jorgensenbacteria bacterium GW2011_GWF2_41_8 TaxID=1618667 RepID=A0A0G0XKM9_9BACT|nr:MAG: hypothetical protein UU83_C0013G0002 [Candidatus Jorgensenbacteria bacterium GW2011_GWF2_41_8]